MSGLLLTLSVLGAAALFSYILVKLDLIHCEVLVVFNIYVPLYLGAPVDFARYIFAGCVLINHGLLHS